MIWNRIYRIIPLFVCTATPLSPEFDNSGLRLQTRNGSIILKHKQIAIYATLKFRSSRWKSRGGLGWFPVPRRSNFSKKNPESLAKMSRAKVNGAVENVTWDQGENRERLQSFVFNYDIFIYNIRRICYWGCDVHWCLLAKVVGDDWRMRTHPSTPPFLPFHYYWTLIACEVWSNYEVGVAWILSYIPFHYILVYGAHSSEFRWFNLTPCSSAGASQLQRRPFCRVRRIVDFY